jgi:hypothetical protein
MKKNILKTLAVTVLSAVSLTAWAVDHYVSGTFNNWAGTHPKYKMTQNGSEYSLTLNGVTAGTYQFKIKGSTWDDINYGISSSYENKSIQFGMAYVMAWSGSNIQITLTETKNVTIIYNTSATTVKVTLSDPTSSPAVTEWKVGENINLTGKYFYFDYNNMSGRADPGYYDHARYSDAIVPEPKLGSTSKYYYFENITGVEGSSSFSDVVCKIPDGKPAVAVPIGFKIKGGAGTEASPYYFELIYDKIHDAIMDLVNSSTVIKFDNKDWYLVNYGGSNVTLLAKECVAASKFKESIFDGNAYSGSIVETVVNNYYNNNISADAKAAVVDDKMFLLSTSEATTIYNANPEILKCNQAEGAEHNHWWLCTPGNGANSNEKAAVVFAESGEVYAVGAALNHTYGVRPAIKVDLSKIEFNTETNTFGPAAATSVATPTLSPADAAKSNIWYDLNGRHYQGKPTMPGVYINNHQKYFVK